MDGRTQAPHKSSSFSPATTRDDTRPRPEVDRNLSLGAVRLADRHSRDHPGVAAVAREQIKEEEEGEGEEEGEYGGAGKDGDGGEPDLAALSGEIDAFISGRDHGDEAVSIPEATLERFAAAVERVVSQSELKQDRWATDANGEPAALLAAIARIAALSSALAKSADGSGGKCTAGVNRVAGVVHRAMAFLEDEFHALLDDPRVPRAASAGELGGKPSPEPDRCVLPVAPDPGPPYSGETVERLRCMADAMVAAGYATECTQMFLVARRNAFDASLRALGYEKASIDDVVRMAWEAQEAEIVAWIKAFRHATNVGLSTERDLCTRVFAGRHAAVGRGLFADLSRCVMLRMLNFAEAVAMTKRAAEKLFRVLDMYEAIRDASPIIDAFLAADADADDDSSGASLTELKAEVGAVRCRLGESAAAIFREFESSIRADAGKQPVPGGAVHPLTRYVMNYVKYACEYSGALEQVFREHGGGAGDGNLFTAQLMEVMELLQGNLEGKSRQYKDPALSSIFLMNNGRYMVQKIRGSPETNAVLGEAWARKQSTSLRQYHKNYQRETWSRVLGLLRDDGVLTVKGAVQKPVLKERFKQFNAAVDEIQRAQGGWVVSDEQLQSELRVSIAAVVVPAYRSFLGRFAQAFSAGRQTEKYVKLSAEDLEALIEELFDGNAATMGSMARRKT